jgi:hypothetical protein
MPAAGMGVRNPRAERYLQDGLALFCFDSLLLDLVRDAWHDEASAKTRVKDEPSQSLLWTARFRC